MEIYGQTFVHRVAGPSFGDTDCDTGLPLGVIVERAEHLNK